MAGVVAALGLAGCTAPGSATAPPASPAQPPAPKDRDLRAVFAALARIDPCTAIESARLTALRARSPSTCEAKNPAGGTVNLGLRRLPAETRLRLPTRTLAGAKAYVQAAAQGSAGRAADCTMLLPVSFELAIAIDVRDAPAAVDQCAVAQTVATAAATAFADPAEADPRWDACAALASAPGTDVGKPESLDLCSDQHSKANFEFRYSTPGGDPAFGWRLTTVSGVEVWTLDDRDPKGPSCTAEWSLGPPESSHAGKGVQLVASLRAVDCARVTPLVEPLVTALRKAPAPVQPQRPLLYPPDESDSPQPGACAYAELPGTRPCAPYVPLPVPADPEEIVRRADTDPNLNCAIALDAVVHHLGPEMRPVTVPNTCAFVTPERLVRVDFSVWTVALQDSVRGQPGAQRTDISGHPAYRLAQQNPGVPYELWVATTTTPSHPGILRLQLAAGPVATPPLPADITAKAIPILSDILRKYFPD